MLLLLGHAFETLGYGRVKIQTDELNTVARPPSQCSERSADVLRRDIPERTVRGDNTVVFAITIDDWPEVRPGSTPASRPSIRCWGLSVHHVVGELLFSWQIGHENTGSPT